MKMSGILLLASAISNIVQGWDCFAAGATVYFVIKEFGVDSGFFFGWCVVTLAVGFLAILLCWGRLSDWLGRRPLLIAASLFYLLHGLLMLWSHGMYMVLLARLVYGLELGFSLTLVKNYFLETEGHEFAYMLTPFLANVCGAWFSCFMVFVLVVTEFRKYWRLMFVVPSVLSLFFFLLVVVYLPETPKWLVSKGRTDEARLVLQQLRGTEDVSNELDMLVMSVGPVEVDPHLDVEEEEEAAADNEQDHRTSTPQEDVAERGEGQTTNNNNISIESGQGDDERLPKERGEVS